MSGETLTLLCCPWCGCQPIVDTFTPSVGEKEIFLRCYSPVCRLPGPSAGTESEAIAKWNNWLVVARRVLSHEEVE